MKNGWQFGAHMSVAGGAHVAIESATFFGMQTCQIFTKNASQWNAKPLKEEDICQFAEAWKASKIGDVFSHASYLINFASPKEELRLKSIEAMLIELERGDKLGLQGVVVHPGAYVTSTEEEGVLEFQRSLSDTLDRYVMRSTQLLIENTAGQGTTLGRSMEQLSRMLKPFLSDPRLGICIDSCHAHASGYDLATVDGLERLIDELDQFQLLEKVKLIHLNDSKKAAGSHVDRHEHIGLGTIGCEGMSRLIHHPEIKKLPLILETEKGLTDDGEEWDLINMKVLHELVGLKYTCPTQSRTD